MPEIDRIHGIYMYACPNCGRENTDLRLSYKAPCPKCLSEEKFREIKEKIKELPYEEIIKTYCENVEKLVTNKDEYGISGRLYRLYKLLENVREFENIFRKATGGYRLWSSQRTWTIRLLKHKSFSIVAPTGMGKTMFALVSSIYFLTKDPKAKIYLVFPTTPLLLQAYKKLVELTTRSGIKVCKEEELGNEDCVTIIAIHGKLSKSKREEYVNLISKGKFNILLSTNMFMHRNYELLLNKEFKLIVMDDVDAILRSGRAIRILFKILGLSDGEIDLSLEYLKLRQKLALRLSEEEHKEINAKLEKYNEVISKIRERIKTIVIVSSATGKPRGIYPKLFRILLGFEVGSRAEAIRNIVDTYVIPRDSFEKILIDLVKKLGSGGLVFVPLDKGVEEAERLANLLKKYNIRAEAFYAGKSIELFNKFALGEIDILIGVATYYGVMVRGLDLPERVKYAIFTGVPRHKFSSKLEKPRVTDILKILTIIRDVLEGEEKKEIELLIGKLTSRIRRLSQGALSKLREDLEKKISGEKVEEYPLLNLIIDALNKTRQLLSRPEIWEKLREKGDIALIRENGKDYILIPDIATYIQASGRTSRLYPGGITRGLSIIIVDDQRLLNGLRKRMKWIYEEFDIKSLNEIKLDELMEEINRERQKVKKILRGEIEPEKTIELTKTALLIVESPNKAKTIANFFGKPSVRQLSERLVAYDVATGRYVLSIIASIGHVYDLAVKTGVYKYGVINENNIFIPVYTDIKKCVKCGYQFTDELDKCPIRDCGGEITRKLDVIKILQDLATEVDMVLIGTDPDTEGEKIGWDLKVLLEPYAREIKRIEFHEITRKAILEAINNPRDFKMNLVEAQIVRRVEDRWLGFALSELAQKYFWAEYCVTRLHKKIINIMRREKRIADLPDCCDKNMNFSAGRVQTPVLGYIIERYKEQSDPSKHKYYALISVNGSTIRLEIDHEYFINLRERLRKGDKVTSYVKVIGLKEEEINPPPPFTTDTLLEEASIRLGLSSTRAMEIAQDLFELGLITYHRTDSIRVSDAGIAVARAYLEEKYGEKYHEYFKPRTWGAGGAHEAIRPTKPLDPDRLRQLVREGILVLAKPLTRQHYELYRLIFERFIASQMRPARIIRQEIEVKINGISKNVERIIGATDKGFLEIYSTYLELEEEVREGEYPVIDVVEIRPPLPRFHDVIKWMKTQGIGRPSTYAKIIQTLLNRRYVSLSKKKKALFPSDRGIIVYNKLIELLPDVVGVEVTKRLEEKMKEIEENKRDYQEVLRELFEELRIRIKENRELINRLEKRYKEICGGI